MIHTEYPAIHKALREQIAALTAELATLAEKYQALDRMFTHAGLVKAQEIHNEMIAERDKIIAELREELAKCSPKTK